MSIKINSDDDRARALLGLVAAGNESAYEELYRLLSRRVYAFVRRMIENADSADEIMVDTMYEVWKTAGRYRGDSRVTTWILGIARNKVLMALRSRPNARYEDIDDFADIIDSGVPVDFECPLVGQFVVEPKLFESFAGLFIAISVPALLLLQAHFKPDKDLPVAFQHMTHDFRHYSHWIPACLQRQQGIQLKDDQRVLEVVQDIAEYIPLKNGKTLTASRLLDRFLFPGPAQYRYVSSLSGGEKRRLYLLTLLMSNPNFFILDEPTNDLDIQTIQVLENFLLDYPGCLLVVSHDRYLMDKLVDHLLVFEGQGQIRYYPGTYSE